MPAEFDVVAYLAGKGKKGRQVGKEIQYPCFFDCAEPEDSKKKKLYLNAEDGVYHCFVCGASGGTVKLQQHFGDEPRQGTSDDGFIRRRILDWAADTGRSMLEANDDALLYLLGRGLEPETIAKHKLGIVTGNWSLTGSLPEGFTREQLKNTGLVHRDGTREGRDYYWNHLLIPYTSRGHVVQMRGRKWGEGKGPKYMSGPGEDAMIFNVDALEGADEAIIVEGEFDAMVLAQHLENSGDKRAKAIAVVGLAGVQTWPKDLMERLADVKRLYIGFDSDEAGKAAAAKLKDAVGQKARILELPNEGLGCDWSDYLLQITPNPTRPYSGHTWRDVIRLMGHASGKRIFSLAEAGMAFREHRATNDGLKTGFEHLDATIDPGLLPGQVMVVLAKTGTGKTVFLCNLAYNMRRHKVLFISLEMTREEVYDRMMRIYLFHNPRATVDELEFAMENIFICDENRLGEQDLTSLVEEFSVETGSAPDVVFVDYLGYYARGAAGNSPYEKTGNAVMQLKADAKAGRFAIITPAQVNRMAKEGKPIDLDDARDAGTVEETADFMLALYRPEAALQNETQVINMAPSGKLKLTVLKSRHGGVGKTFTLQMDVLTLAVVDDDKPSAKTAADHNLMTTRGITWADLRAVETAPRQMRMRT